MWNATKKNKAKKVSKKEVNGSDRRVLTVQDISCVGQCSLTVALPVISACGVECAVLPSCVLSNHTAFDSWTFRDLTGDMEKILEKWLELGFLFDAFYTGYVSKSQIPVIAKIMKESARSGAWKIVDPVMADNGKMYAGFDDDFPEHMKILIKDADVALPNISEACFLTGVPYKAGVQEENYVERLLKGVASIGAKKVVLTGVSLEKGKIGFALYEGEKTRYYFTELLDYNSHGTGDLYASVFTGALMRGCSVYESAVLAADTVVLAMKQTHDDKTHWYGVKFERTIPYLVSRLSSYQKQ